VVDAPDAASAVLKHSKIGGKINPEALNNLFYEDELNKRRLSDRTDNIGSFDLHGSKQVKIDASCVDKSSGSLLSGLTLKF
jgi:hypothetical protein